MLKVVFPIGEFFHEHHYHHSAEEECTHATGKQCNHQAHYSHTHEHPHDCIFNQLHTFFTQPYFLYTIVQGKITTYSLPLFQPVAKVTIYTPSRAPPLANFTA